MIQKLLMLAFAMPSLIVIRAAMGDNLAWYESLAAGIVAAMFSFVWIRSIEKCARRQRSKGPRSNRQSHRRAAMSQAETVSRLRRLADDWRKEEKQLCEQFGNEIIPHSMRARKIKDTKAIGTEVEMIERTAKTELEIRDRNDLITRLQNELRGYREREKTMGWQE